MANFIFFLCSAFSGTPNNGFYWYDDLSFTDVGATYSYYSAYNNETNVVYISTTALLAGVNAATRATLYSTDGAHVPMFVDANDHVWCTKSTDAVFVFESDLAAVTEHTLAADNPLNNSVDYVTPTLDGQYVYLLDNAASGKIAKYDVDNLDGGDPEWSTDVASVQCIFCDGDGHVYTLTTSGLAKYDADSGEQLWTAAAGGYFGFYSPLTNRIYVPDSANTRFLEYTTAGVSDGYATDPYINNSAPPRCIGGNSSKIYACLGKNGAGSNYQVWQYPHSDWGSPEDDEDSRFWFLYDYRFSGDPMGFIHYILVNYPDAAFTGTPTSGYPPLSVQFTDDTEQTTTAWSWDFGDDNTSTDQDPTNIYAHPGVYTVSLTATTAIGEDTETKVDYIEVSTDGMGVVADMCIRTTWDEESEVDSTWTEETAV